MTKFRHKVLVAAISAAISIPSAFACTSVIVGKKASENGSIFLSRTEDFSSNNWSKHVVVYPRQEHKAGEMITLSNGLEIPAPKTSLRYTALRDWDAYQYNSPNGGRVFEERGVNEFNVAMSATNSAEINDKANKVDPLVEQGFIEENMVGPVLSQAKTAREAVQLLGRYVEKYGAGEANGVQFADLDEAWYMEIGSGHHWIAVRVPDDQYLVIANGLRIHDVNLSSRDVMHSKGLYDFVKQNKLLNKPDRKQFNFAQAFGVINDHYNTDREWRGQQMLSPSVKQKTRQAQYPLFMKADKKIGIADVAAVLRSDYQGTELAKKGERPIGVDRNSEAHIIELNPAMPKELAAVIWQTPSSVKYSPFIPVFNVMEKIPAAYTEGSDKYSTGSAWWAFRSVGALANKNVLDGKYSDVVSQAWHDVEMQYIKDQSQVNSYLSSVYKQDKDQAITFASNYSNGLMHTTLEKAQMLQAELLTDLTRSTEKKYSPEEFEKIKNL